MVLGAVLIGEASLSYLDENKLHPFILEKGQLARPTFFITALYVHVASALVALPTCSILLSRRRASSWNTSPKRLLITPKIAFLRYFGMKTT